MKQLFTLFLSLFCVGAALAASAAKDTIEVFDAEQFIKVIQQDNGVNIRLREDIQLGELKSHICDTFTGSINGYYEQYDDSTKKMIGCEHVIYGDPSRMAEWTNTEMFAKVENADFRYVCFANIFVDVSNHSNTGVIASNAITSNFVGVRFKNIKVSGNNDNVGIVAGQADGCFFGATLFDYCEVYANGRNAGGIVGSSIRCDFECCDTAISCCAFADGRETSGGAYVGGFSGHSTNDEFKTCVNGAMVAANSNKAGGFTGFSQNSNFFECQNGGYIVHSSRSNFETSFKQLQDSIDAIDDTELMSTIVGAVGVGVTTLAGAFSPWLIKAIHTRFIDASIRASEIWTRVPYDVFIMDEFEIGEGVDFITVLPDYEDVEEFWELADFQEYQLAVEDLTRNGNMVGYCRAILLPLAVVIAVEIGATIAWNIYSGDDETGGISSHAVGGKFERCNNFGNLRCKDDNCGAIVGLGKGVTINNCFNSGVAQWDEKDTSASILGKAEVDESNGNKKCLVTNCLSTWAFHIVGDEDIEDGLNSASGNNYRMAGDVGEDVFCEMQINKKQLESGIVALWLNQGIENRSLGITPWRQTLIAEADSLKDKCPVLNLLHSVVTAVELAHDTIRNADELMAFAEKVNKGDQFACAVLDDDIVMPADTPWMPIGWSDSKFRGVFDGQGHTISGLNQYSIFESAGLFGTVHAGATIRNVTVKDSQITNLADNGTAGIVGYVGIEGWSWGNVIIENCASYANIYASRYGGGILGLVNTKTENDPAVHVIVENCYNGGTITTLLGNSGLLCGWTKHNAHIRNCWSAGELRHDVRDGKGTCCPFSTKTSNNSEPEYLAGYDSKIDIQNCYIVNAKKIIDDYAEGKMQDGVTDINEAELASGELAYQLNDSVCDGTQAWYQKLSGEDADPYPVLTKLPDGSNMVLPYRLLDSNGIAGFANTNREMISDVILGKKKYADFRVTDVNYDKEKPGDVDVVDLIQFIKAANR